MTWKQLTERDCRDWKLLDMDPHDRHTWKSSMKSAMRAASQLLGRGPTVNVAPVLHVNQKSVDDDDDDDECLIRKHIIFICNM